MEPSRESLLPGTFGEAALRGARARCPRCGKGNLFRKWLKPRDNCPVCTLDLTHQSADDFPAYIAIIVTGHLLAPLVIAMVRDWDMGPAAIFSVLIPLALAMMLGMLQPAKGAVIAAQWWFGLNGFRRERVALEPAAPEEHTREDHAPEEYEDNSRA